MPVSQLHRYLQAALSKFTHSHASFFSVHLFSIRYIIHNDDRYVPHNRQRVYCFFYYVDYLDVAVVQDPEPAVIETQLATLDIDLKVVTETNEKQFISVEDAFILYLSVPVKRVDVTNVMRAVTAAWEATSGT